MITKEQLQYLTDHGIMFSYWPKDGGPGFYELTVTQVLKMLQSDRTAFDAALKGVSIEQYKAWIDFLKDDYGTCRAITKKGTRCRNTICWTRAADDPKKFMPGIHDRCWIHQNVDPK